jgi:hypothetical protein
MYQGPFSIPTKTDDELKALVAKTQPLVRRRDHLGDHLCMIRLPDLRGCAFPWDPKFIESPGGLVEVARATTLHRYGYHGFFKPSIAEVLCQMPEGLDADFFEVVGPEMADDLNKELPALNAGFHVATTIFYKRK